MKRSRRVTITLVSTVALVTAGGLTIVTVEGSTPHTASQSAASDPLAVRIASLEAQLRRGSSRAAELRRQIAALKRAQAGSTAAPVARLVASPPAHPPAAPSATSAPPASSAPASRAATSTPTPRPRPAPTTTSRPRPRPTTPPPSSPVTTPPPDDGVNGVD